ncbi:putative mitochondrial protein [Cucumis melo var. makuwa]|uniref:Mitochondrial protein n=1 Tax=Cucumis melo var. makuwa TaxID=1194695 RepID=A0A5A7TFT4_CUCMM|nr:putative mitochondrial protein [Cucumis melo var. makuwa]
MFMNNTNNEFLVAQEKYARNLIKKFDLEQAKAKCTHTTTHIKVFKYNRGKKVHESLYRNIIGSLLYLLASPPNTAYVVGVCAQYQVDPSKSHLRCAKCILKAVLGTNASPSLPLVDPTNECGRESRKFQTNSKQSWKFRAPISKFVAMVVVHFDSFDHDDVSLANIMRCKFEASVATKSCLGESSKEA